MLLNLDNQQNTQSSKIIPIDIEKEMREAAKNLDFERAMELRDILFEMKTG